MARISRVYIESSCLINFAKSKSPQVEESEWFVQQLMNAGRDKAITLYTSTLTIAECLDIQKGRLKPTERVQILFRSILTSGDVFIPIAADYFIAIGARDLRWKHNIYLKGADGIHLASALSMECDEFITDDPNDFLKKTTKENAANLGIRIVRPQDTKCLPNKYRQDEMFDNQ